MAKAVKRPVRRGPVSPLPSSFSGFRFPPEVILLAVRWYLRYGLSYRDLEELLAERGIDVDHVTLYRWVQRFTPELIDAARPSRHLAGDRWFVDETYVKVAGIWRYVYRAVDQHGQVIDVYVSNHRDIAAARTFFTTALTAHGSPAEVVTDRARRWRTWSTTCSQQRCAPPSSTPTTASSAITAASSPGYDRCAV
jgi:IS6 family transposase